MSKVNIWKFENATEIANFINEKGFKDGYAFTFHDPDFCRDTMAKALRNCGGSEIYETKTVRMADDVLESLKAVDEGKNQNMPEVVFDVTGQECDIERYMNGEPENMRNFEPSTEKRRLNMILMPIVSCCINQESQEARGAAFLALLDRLLEMNRFIIHVSVPISVKLDGDLYVFLLKFDLSKIVSRQALAYLATAPSVTRRIYFALLEIARGEKDLKYTGYGHCVNFDDVIRHMKKANKSAEIMEMFGEAEGRIVYDTMNGNTDVSAEIERAKNSVKKYAAATTAAERDGEEIEC